MKFPGKQLVPTETMKFPGKLHVWGMMSYNGLSDLHLIPKGQSVNASYYIEEILCKTMLSSLQGDGEIGGVCERRSMPDMSSAIFQKDGAPTHTAKITQNSQNKRPKLPDQRYLAPQLT